ncbi:MAG: hypothetical protein OES15_08530 [Nitrosopumilus sp.]|nr:hypothetical protein [Nitrosopumilus sp.]MDH3853913.1 hypothetical protein [Nitrosopumilus sp.]
MLGTGSVWILDEDVNQSKVNQRIMLLITGFIFAGSGSASTMHSLGIIL